MWNKVGEALNRKEISVVLIILAVCVLFIGIVTLTGDRGKYAVISVDGETVFRGSLENQGIFTVPQIHGMKFEISDEGIRVAESDCPDKICVKSGYISNSGMTAVCMPNKVVVTVEDDADE